jgi:hypothetical protein
MKYPLIPKCCSTLVIFATLIRHNVFQCLRKLMLKQHLLTNKKKFMVSNFASNIWELYMQFSK